MVNKDLHSSAYM